ncbi:MAG: STAS domain-containing protein [Sulfuriflexus sp.]|nr:STAS domain-containing protein [Sulfuriflexus sp.]
MQKKAALIDTLLPFMAWLPELTNKTTLRADLIAGITVALVLIPQSMAYAALAGLPPYYGLYAAFLPPIVAALFGSSRQLATGPVAVVSLLTASALEPLATAGSESYIVYAILLALMVGIFQLSLGLLRLGVLVNFLSHPVVMGFTNAAAIIIATSQLPKIFGIVVEKEAHHYETVWNTLVIATTDTHMLSLVFAILAFSIMALLKKYYPKLPGVLFAVVITTVLASVMDYEKTMTISMSQVDDKAIATKLSAYQNSQVIIAELKTGLIESQADSNKYAEIEKGLDEAIRRSRGSFKALQKEKYAWLEGKQLAIESSITESQVTDGNRWQFNGFTEDGDVMLRAGGRIVGDIPKGLPSIRFPELDFSLISQLFFAAITIGLIGFMEAIAIAKAMATRTRQRLDTNQELVGQGISNIVGSLFQSYPTSGSFSRSAVNIGAGAITGFSSVVTGLVVLITLLFFTELLYNLPQATLAAVIMMAVIGLVNVKHFIHTWKVYRSDGIIAMITFFLTLIFAPHLENAIIIGVILSLGMFLYRSMKPRVAALSRFKDGTLRDADLHQMDTCEYVSVIRFDGPLYFANTSYFEDMIIERSANKSKLKYIVVDGQGVNSIDATGEEMLVSLTRRLEKTGVIMIFANFKRQVMLVLHNSGFMEQFGGERFFATADQALDAIWEELGDSHDIVECPLTMACVVEGSGEN